MKLIPLTQGYVTFIDDDDYERVSQHTWHAAISRNEDGSIRHVYAASNVFVGGRYKIHKLHRFLLNVTDSTIYVDHRDRDSLNNQKHNLRTASHAQNKQNQRVYRNNTSGGKGVHWHSGKKKWEARLQVGGKRLQVGSFDDRQQAIAAYDTAAMQHHQAFAATNKTLGVAA